MVLKVGGSLLLKDNKPDVCFIESLASSIARLLKEEKKAVVVSSGAIALGKKQLGSFAKGNNTRTIPSKQAFASIGQIHLMNFYFNFFEKYGFPVGQILLSAGDLSQRSTYINARNTLLALLNMGVVPVVNENDTVAVEEIKFGDNDTLSALVAGLIDADLLIILSDIEGLYTADPKRDSTARLLPYIRKIDRKIEKMAQDSCVEGRAGGMQTKINAAKIATRSGIPVLIGGGKSFLEAFFDGRQVGTVFLPTQNKLQARKKWIAYGARIKGDIVVDEGAKRALVEGKSSLLPVGIKKVRGRFRSGDTVSLVGPEGKEFARGIAYYTSSELREVKGLHTQEIEKKLGYKYYDEAIHRDNLVVL